MAGTILDRDIPPLSTLRCFEIAARSESFSAAADALCLTPSAVSHQIRALEAYLGRQLFVRVGRRMLLTEDGKAYASRISRALRDIQDATRDLKHTQAADKITIRAAPSFANAWLVPNLASFIRSNPALGVQLITAVTSADAEVDCEVRYGHGKWPQTKADLLWTEQLTPLAAGPVAATIQSPDDLVSATLIHTRSRVSGWSNFLALHGLASRSAEDGLDFDRTSLALEAARNGLGIALESPLLARGLLREGALVSLFGDLAIEDEAYYFVTARAEVPRKVAAFRSWLFSSFGGNPADAAQLAPSSILSDLVPGAGSVRAGRSPS